MKRNKRKAEGERKHQILIEQLENFKKFNNSNLKNNSDKTDQNNQSKNLKFTDKIDEFWEIYKSQSNIKIIKYIDITWQNVVTPESSNENSIIDFDDYVFFFPNDLAE